MFAPVPAYAIDLEFMSELEGHVALVTGGARRIGRAIVEELARAGCDVAIHYHRSEREAEETRKTIEAIGRRACCVGGDLRLPQTWETLVRRSAETLDRLDFLVNNASAFLTETPDTLEEFDASCWDAMFRLNVTACVGLVHHAREHLAESGHGCVVNLCDVSWERPWKNHLAYCASKAALVAVTRGLARAMAPRVRVNGVAPGIAVFPESYSTALRRQLIDRVPLKREGTPEGVAKLVRFICESSSYLTGQVISLDGGRSTV